MSRFLAQHTDKLTNSYAPSFFESDSGFLNERHAELVTLLEPVDGWLQRGDHHKLYEAAYFSEGPVLEIGRYHGKSTCIIAMGLEDSGAHGPFYSIDVAPSGLDPSRRNLARFGLEDKVDLIVGDSVEEVRRLGGVFDTVFVDGDHSFAGVTRDLEALRHRVRQGGVVMFHDCFDQRNLDPDNHDYGVGPAVDAMKDELGFAFRGQFGAIGVFEQMTRPRRVIG